MKKLLCWWFGCKIEINHPCEKSPNHVVPCKRCGADDTDYADRVGDTRYNRTKDAVNYWVFRKWLPKKCPDCGKRYGDHSDCLPF